MSFSDPPRLVASFTLHVDLAAPHDIGPTLNGDQRFIPITGGTITGPRLHGKILPGGGDWNLVRPDGIVHLLAKYTISLPEGDGSDTLVTITNEGIGRASQEIMKGVFEDANPSSFSNGRMGNDNNGGLDGVTSDGCVGESDAWYTRTSPRFEVRQGSKYQFLCRSLWLGVLKPPQEQGKVVIDVFRVD